MSEPLTSRVHPDFHPMLKFPAPDFQKPWLVAFLRAYARLNFAFTRAPRWVSVQKHTVAGSHQAVSITHFTNTQITGQRPVIIFYHGGGFVMPAFGFHKALLFEYMEGANCDAVFVDYGLSPEHKASDILPQCFSVLEWARKQAQINANKIAVVGDSAGGAIAASVAQMAFEQIGEGAVACQLLIYPVTDNSLSTESTKAFHDSPCWSGKASAQMWRAYDASSSPHAVPMLLNSVKGLAPAYIETAEVDPLHDEGVAFANKLKAAGVDVCLHDTHGTVHGFDSTLQSSITLNSIKKRSEFLRNHFGEGGVSA